MLIPTLENTKNVTEMREKTLQLLADVKKLGTVYIMQRSSPRAVMLSIDEFKRLQGLVEDRVDERDAARLSTQPRGVGISHEKMMKKYARKKGV